MLITAPDRLARNYVHPVVLLEELEQHGCQVQFLDRPMSHDPHDQLLLQIRGAVAEYERTLITERMRRGRQRKLAAGLLDETAFRLPCGPGPSTRSGRRTDRRIRSRHCARDVCLGCGGVAQFLFAGPPAS